MVVTVHHDATDAGVEILKQGGNAVDAAVAVGFALAVVHPEAGNIGGGGFMLVLFKNGKSHFMDYREEAPGAATMNMYLDAQGNVIPDASTVGYRSIGVPGSVAGMVRAEKLWGKLTLAQVMQPAIRLARNGFVLSDEEAQEMQDPLLTKFPASRHIFQRDGDFYRAGETFRQPELAATLERIAKNPRDFYHGAMAAQIAEAIQKGGGLITAKDLAAYKAKDRRPLVGEYQGYKILTAPPPSGGGIGLLETLNILAPYDLTALGDRSPREMHYVVEAFRRAYMDRTDYLGDPDFTLIPVKQMISLPYAAAFRASILPDKATPSSTLKRPAGFLPPPPKLAPPHHESNQTTHYSIVDADGNAVAVTTTLNNSFGSGVTVPGLGFLLNDEMDDFASKQGVPNMYGLIQGPANAIGPRKRPLSAMTPTIVTRGWQGGHGAGFSGRAAHHDHGGEYFSKRGGRRVEHSASSGCAPIPSPISAGHRVPGAGISGEHGERAAGDAIHGSRRAALLEQRRMHRGRSQNRRTRRWPGSSQPLRQGGGILNGLLICPMASAVPLAANPSEWGNLEIG